MIGKLLYGLLFVAVLPALLVAWSVAAADVVHLPAVQSPELGLTLAVAGALLMLLGIGTLWVAGGGVPMNFAPPPRYVRTGIYRLVPHPIYIGFSAACVGVALIAGSASGLWLVSPSVMLAACALVLGFEGHELRARFPQAGEPPLLRLPRQDETAPSPGERSAAYVYVLVPWLLLYEAVLAVGPAPDARSAYLPFEHAWPVLEWTEAIYASTYLIVGLAPLIAPDRRSLRRFMIRGLRAMALVFPLYLIVPLVAAPRPFTPQGVLGQLLQHERALDGAAGSFPSFHVIWAVLAAAVVHARLRRARVLCAAWAVAVALSCLTTGMHALIDVLAAFAVVWGVDRAPQLWAAIRALAERLANSWREWELGAVRIINHGAWAGLGTFLALSLVSALSAGALTVTLLAALLGLVGAALWAQLIEGSPRLLRPYGFYGGMLGIVLGALAAPLSGQSPWLILSAYCAAAPIVQSFGRVRCLVQGCCHGGPACEQVGIRYTHPRSRVVRLSELAGMPIHPTPVYSMLWNLVIVLVVGRLWSLHAPLHLIGGVYLILNGTGRFVEEHYRGEPQTPVYAKLRLYQWISLATVGAGALITAVAESAPAPSPEWHPRSLAAALAFGLLTACALGVDFPKSGARFSRLV